MADKKISELTALTGANTATDDQFVVVDTSAGETKKISLADLETAIGKGGFYVDGTLTVYDTTGSLTTTKDVTAEFRRADGTCNPRLQVRHSTDGTDINHTYSAVANALTFSIGGDEAMRIDSDGHVIAPYGITLGTSVGTYNANNTLDDYEEGSIPASSFTVGGQAITGLSTGASYVKVGNKVTIFLSTQDSSVTLPTTGELRITLPFTPSINRPDTSLVTSYITAGTWNSGVSYPRTMVMNTASSTQIAFLPHNNLNDRLSVTATGSGYFWIFGSFTYTTA